MKKKYFQAFLTTKPNQVVTELEKIQKIFLWGNSASRIKRGTLCNNYKDSGIKNKDIRKKN